MIFSAPAALWALPAVGAPFVIHWLSRRTARKISFSDLSLLAGIESRSRPRTRLKDALLLLARTVLILALILTAAGPFARGSNAAVGEGLDLVILLDASYSMRAVEAGRARFDLARDAGSRLLQRLKPGDRVAVGVFSESLDAPLSWSAPEEAGRLLAASRPSHRRTNAAGALSAARELLTKSPRGRRRAVVVLGDGAAHMLPEDAPRAADDTVILGLKFEGLSNAWISGAVPAKTSSAKDPSLEVRVAATGSEYRSNADVWVKDARGASIPFAVRPGHEAARIVSLPPASDPARPRWAGRVVLRGDALAEDDASYFSLRHESSPRVLVLYGDPAFDRAGHPGWFFRQYFGAGERSLAEGEADFLASARWREADLARYGTILIPDADRLSPDLASALERFTSGGGGLWLIPGTRASENSFSGPSAWLPARIGSPEAVFSPRGMRVAASAAQTRNWNELELARLTFSRRYRLDAAPGAAEWLTDSTGSALLVAGPVGRGRAVVWAVPLDVEWTNLGLKPAFIPWAAACLSLTRGAPEADSSAQARVAEPLTMSWSSNEAAPERVSVRAPDGRTSIVTVRDRRAVFPSADAPGLYDFTWPGGGQATYAVNVDASHGESDLTPASSPPWTAVAPDALEAAFDTKVYGEDRRAWFIGTAAVALVIESLLSLPGAALAVAACLVFGGLTRAEAQQGDRFVWTQLQMGADWDPYPDAPNRVLNFLGEVTSARVAPERRVATLSDAALFSSPFVYLAGRERPMKLSDGDMRRLRQFIAGGGFLWIEDSTGGPPGSFDRWVRETLSELLPQSDLRPLPTDHVLYRTFFLLRGPAGRVAVSGALEGAVWDGRVAVLYSRDDVLGAWALDAFGRPLKPCVPGGQSQRVRAQRLTLNILMYAMTGSYKSDAVHQSAILEKLKGAAGP